MRRELGAMFMLQDYAEPFDGGDYELTCTVKPESSLCQRCFFLRNDWYPKRAPKVVLHMHEAAMCIPHLGPPIIHEAMWDVLCAHWPKAKATRCVSQPASPLKIGEKYVCLSIPQAYRISPLSPRSTYWMCKACERIVVSLGNAPGAYLVMTQEESENIPLRWDNNYFYMTMPLRRAVDKLKISEHGWVTYPIFNEPAPENVMPKRVAKG